MSAAVNPNFDERKYVCCISVEVIAAVIAVLGILFTVFRFWFVTAFGTISWQQYLLTLGGLLIFGTILLALRKRNPHFYLPILIANGIGMVILAGNSFFPFIEVMATSTCDTERDFGGLLLLCPLLTLLGFVQWIMCRAWKWMMLERAAATTPITGGGQIKSEETKNTTGGNEKEFTHLGYSYLTPPGLPELSDVQKV